MRRGKLFFAIAVFCFTLAHAFQAPAADKSPVDYVDPNIGTIGHLLRSTKPVVQLPHSMMRMAPVTTPGIRDVYLADKIFGFPLGNSMVAATSGNLHAGREANASTFDHDLETAAPYYYTVLLEDFDILTEYTVTERAAIFRFHFQRPEASHVLFSAGEEGAVEYLGNGEIRGMERNGNVTCYWFAKIDGACSSFGTWNGESISQESKSVKGDDIGFFMSFTSGEARMVSMKAALSYISYDRARRNLETEIPDWNFEQVESDARDAWNEELGRILVEGGTDEQKTIFYTALYRSLSRMVNISEYGRYYSGFDNTVHEDGGNDFYVDDWLWDTYRCMHPLQLILDPVRKRDMIRSYITMYEQSGWLPLFPDVGGDRPCMIGHHASSMITDAYAKGVRDFDAEKAYEAMKKNAMYATMLPWANGPSTELEKVYFEKGFFPALPAGEKEWVEKVHDFERRQSVAVTLEHSYDDWCVAQMAGFLGKEEDKKHFMERAHNYRTLFNSRTGFMSPKTADGEWVEPFDPKLSGGQGGRDYFAECNSWVYTWSVQHDPEGLIRLMGGPEEFVRRLDRLFVEQYDIPKYKFLSQFPDATGLIGQYVQGDEPAFHITYLYNYAGAPYKTQRRVREAMKVWYDDDPLGICGDEDGGAMSAWYVMSAMGFYPVCPGRPVYDIGSPLFEKITITPKGGKRFTIIAKNASVRNKYIQSAELNGAPHNKPWFTHNDLAAGGELVLEMGDRPNKEWGSSPEDAPPSMTRE